MLTHHRWLRERRRRPIATVSADEPVARDKWNSTAAMIAEARLQHGIVFAKEGGQVHAVEQRSTSVADERAGG